MSKEQMSVEAVARFFIEMREESKRALAKHPKHEHLLVALMEEVGELSRAHLEGEGTARIREEAVQVAALAMRIALCGDDDFKAPCAHERTYSNEAFGEFCADCDECVDPCSPL